MSEQYTQREDLKIFVIFLCLLRTTILLLLLLLLLLFFILLILLLLILLPAPPLVLDIWDVTPCSFIERYRRFGGICYPDLILRPKPWCLSTKLHGLISCKTVILMPPWEPWIFPTRYLYIFLTHNAVCIWYKMNKCNIRLHSSYISKYIQSSCPPFLSLPTLTVASLPSTFPF